MTNTADATEQLHATPKSFINPGVGHTGVDDIGRPWADVLNVIVTPRRSFRIRGTVSIAEAAAVPFVPEAFAATNTPFVFHRIPPDRAACVFLDGLPPDDRLLLGILLDAAYDHEGAARRRVKDKLSHRALRDFLADHGGDPKRLLGPLHRRTGTIRRQQIEVDAVYVVGNRLAVPQPRVDLDKGTSYHTAVVRTIAKNSFVARLDDDRTGTCGPGRGPEEGFDRRLSWSDAARGEAAMVRLLQVPAAYPGGACPWMKVVLGACTAFRVDLRDMAT